MSGIFFRLFIIENFQRDRVFALYDVTHDHALRHINNDII